MPEYNEKLNHPYLGALLYAARKRKNLSRKALEKISAISAVSIAKYEKAGTEGGQYPPVTKLAQLALVLELDCNLLLSTCLKNEDDLDAFLENKLAQNMEDFFFTPLLGAIGEKIKNIFTPVNEKPEEASLDASSSGSNPETLTERKDHGQPSD